MRSEEPELPPPPAHPDRHTGPDTGSRHERSRPHHHRRSNGPRLCPRTASGAGRQGHGRRLHRRERGLLCEHSPGDLGPGRAGLSGDGEFGPAGRHAGVRRLRGGDGSRGHSHRLRRQLPQRRRTGGGHPGGVRRAPRHHAGPEPRTHPYLREAAGPCLRSPPVRRGLRSGRHRRAPVDGGDRPGR